MAPEAELLPGTLDLSNPESRLPRRSTRVRRPAANRTDHGRRAGDRTGRLVPCALSPRTPGTARHRVGHVRQQPQGQVLHPDGRRSKAVEDRRRTVESDRPGDEHRPPGTGGMNAAPRSPALGLAERPAQVRHGTRDVRRMAVPSVAARRRSRAEARSLARRSEAEGAAGIRID